MEVNRPAPFSSSVAKECTLSVHAGYVAGGVQESLLRMCNDGCDIQAGSFAAGGHRSLLNVNLPVVSLFAQHQALDGGGTAGSGIRLDEECAQPSVAACGLELAWHAADKSLNY
jgi:hypothetical protein